MNQPQDPLDSDETEALSHGTFTIHGTGSLIGVTSTGIVNMPLDLSAAPFASYSLSGGVLVRQVGAGKADGTFTVPVEAGATSWELETNQFGSPYDAVGDARHPSLSRVTLGRLDGVVPTAETDVTINATGLDAWADGDSTQIVVANNGGVIFSPEFQFATSPSNGDTSISGQTIDWAAQGIPLVDKSKGDVVAMTQLVERTSGTEAYSAVARYGTAHDYTQAEGVASTLNVAMSAVPQRSLALHWRGADFEALLPDVGAGASDFPGADGVFIDALPDAASFGFYTTSPDLMLYTPTDSTANLEPTVTYGNPYTRMGRPWDEYAIINYFFAVPVRLGSAAPYNELVGYDANLSLAELHGVVKPLISPARHVRIAGKDLGSPQTGVGASPIVRWDAPAIGNATQYLVNLKSLMASSSGTSSTFVATFITKDRSFQIPSDYLASGTTYILTITAINFGFVDRTRDLFGDGLPFESASSVTSTFTP